VRAYVLIEDEATDGLYHRNLGPIVNSENSNGSVYTMLLGSFTEGSDSEKREALRTPFPKEDEPFDPDSD
jgi:hypothetical protein